MIVRAVQRWNKNRNAACVVHVHSLGRCSFGGWVIAVFCFLSPCKLRPMGIFWVVSCLESPQAPGCDYAPSVPWQLASFPLDGYLSTELVDSKWWCSGSRAAYPVRGTKHAGQAHSQVPPSIAQGGARAHVQRGPAPLTVQSHACASAPPCCSPAMSHMVHAVDATPALR